MSGNNLFLKKGYVNAPLKNGLGRFILQCQRITIKFCKSHGGSKGVRDFIQNDLVNFARQNPSVVTYVKPRRHRSPVMVAEYLNGHREWMSLHDFDREEVILWMEHMKTSGGQGEMMHKTYNRTDNPSIQGPWNPFTNKLPHKNIATFPNDDYAKVPRQQKSATEILKQYFEEQQSSTQQPK